MPLELDAAKVLESKTQNAGYSNGYYRNSQVSQLVSFSCQTKLIATLTKRESSCQ